MNACDVFALANMNSITESLGWVLIHSVWQFAAVAIVATLVVRCLRRSSANTRYSFLVFAMATLALSPIATWYAQAPGPVVARGMLSEPSRLERLSAKPSRSPQATSDDRFEIPFEQQGSAIETESNFTTPTLNHQPKPARLSWNDFKSALRPWLAWIVVLWCLGVIACALRPMLSWFAIRRMRRVGTLPVSNELLDVLQRVSRQLGVTRSVQLFQSSVVQVPVVLGYLRPMILLPISLLNNLPISLLETILTHELAHVRRHDFLINLLQTIVETFFFYHPAVWWLSNRIRIEREHCCDDLVIHVLGNRVEYGRALVAIEQLRNSSGILALSASDGSMLARIRRIVAISGSNRTASRWSPWNIVATSLAIVAMSGLLSWQSFAQTSSKPTESKPAQTQVDEAQNANLKFSDELKVKLTRQDAHSRSWYFIDLEKGELKKPPFTVDIDTTRLPYFVNKPSEKELNEWLVREGVDLIVHSEIYRPNRNGPIEKNEIQVRSVRTLLQDLPYSLQPDADKSWTWTTNPQDVAKTFSRKDEAVHVTGFVPNSFAGDIRPDSPILQPFRTANNVLGLFLLEQPSATEDELTLRIVHVKNCTSPLADLRFGPDDFVSGQMESSNSAANESVDVPFIAKLPNDVRVEFVGITEGAGDIKAAERWWKPDGTPLGLAPKYGGAGGGSEEEDRKNPFTRTVMHVHGIVDDSAVTATAAIQTAETKVDESGGRYVAHYGYTDAPAATRSYEVGVATEPLSLVRWLDRNGKRQGVRIKDSRPGRAVGFALVGRMDIDGDSTDDSEKLKALIRMASGHIDAVLDAKLVTEGSLGTSTAFVVLGSDVDSVDNKEQSAQYAAFIREAKNYGATQISLPNLMGYLKEYKWPLDPIAEDITIEKIGPESWGRHVGGYGPLIDPIGPGDEQGGRKTGTTQVTIRVPLKWRQVDLRLFAIDKAGESHGVDLTVRLEPNEENADYTRLAKILPVAFEDVEHFEYQFRLYRHWVTFENVSLRKGNETQVNVKRETIPQTDANAPAVVPVVLQPEFVLPDFLNVRSVGFSADSQSLVSVATKEEVTIRTWSIAEKQLISEVKLDRAVDDAPPLHGNQFLMSGLKLSQDLKRLVGCVQGKVRIWNAEDGKLIQTLPNPVRGGGAIASRGLTSTPNFDSIAAAIGDSFSRSLDCEIAVWQGEGYGRIKRLTHSDAVQITSISLSTDGSRLASGSQNATTCVFDLATSKLLYTLPNSNGDRKHSDSQVSEAGANQILCLAFSPDGKKLAIGDMLGVKIVDATDGKLFQTIESEFRFGMSGLVFSSDGKLLARTATDKTVPIWSTETGKLVTELPTEAHDAAVSNDGKWFATGFSDDKHALSVWKRSADPQKSTTKLRATLHTEKIVINKDGEIWLDRTAVTLDELRTKLDSMSNNSFEIEADKDVPYTKVVEVLNTLKAAGVTELSFTEVRLGDGKVRVANSQAIYKLDDNHGFSICRPNGRPHYFTVHWQADGNRPACMLRIYPQMSEETVGKWAVGWEPGSDVLWWVDDTNVSKMNLKDPASVVVSRESRLSKSFSPEFGLPEGVKTEFRRLGYIVGLDSDPIDKDLIISPRPGTPGRGAGGEGQATIVSALCGQWNVYGKVTDTDGKPLAKVLVRVSSQEEIKTTLTDPNGNYSANFYLSLQQLAKWRGVKVEPILDGYVERDMAKSGEFNALLYADEKPQRVRIAGESNFEAGPIPSFAQKDAVLLHQGLGAATADFVMVKADEK
ncbi:MAG: M56 family metallopeptidase [Pirellulaceae bacterium]|nr:M56 family metallopeptidase [Pirellulaceae bacterium]